MYIDIGKPVDWWSTTRLDRKWSDWRGLNANDAVETRLDKMVFGALDAWQSVLNVTINKFNDWRGRRVIIQIDHFDTWSMDHTLAMIVVPMLKQLRETKHGAPFVDNKDVPKQLRGPKKPASDGSVDKFFFDRWDYVLAEMIWAFTYVRDEDADYDSDRKPRIDRANNGFRLFGKYYMNLWD